MEVTQIIAEIDSQIGKLQQARALLLGVDSPKPTVGRPRKIAGTSVAKTVSDGTKRKRNLSPDARKRIADAQKRRWAERRKAGD